MRQNVASQVVGAQMIAAADGTAFTGAVTCSVTGDGGSQATGSVGSGACTHEGNGFHTYGPAQAETNYAHVAFTFTGTGAIPVTVQVYTSFPQTGDSFARLGAPAGASVSADIAAIEAQTDDIGVAGAGLTAVPWNAAWDAEVQSEVADALAVYDPPTNAEMEARTIAAASYATAAALDAVDNFLDTEITAILADTNELQTDWADGGRLDLILDARASQTSVNTIDDLLDTEMPALTTAVADIPTNAELATALGTADDAVLAAIAALENISAAEVNAEVDTAIQDAFNFSNGNVNANVEEINTVAITGDGQVGTEFGV